ncbi:MAG: SDR family NAD(P)-dependent oxidoreductase, partial [Actinobacteria bacterium]|nr:SDR family NAD(P)-dependent oxidoreductase [Actinomycetota bacterium]
MEFKDKRVLITGAGSGLGKELTTHLLDLGATVIAVDKNLSK